MIFEIKQYIQQQTKVTIDELSVKFNLEKDAVSNILNRWVLKKKIRCYTLGLGCAGCAKKCSKQQNLIKIFEWI